MGSTLSTHKSKKPLQRLSVMVLCVSVIRAKGFIPLKKPLINRQALLK